MTKQLPRFPQSLPPPVEIAEGPRQVFLIPEQLSNSQKILDLIYDLYWFSDDLYFLFYPHGEGIGLGADKRLESYGVAMNKTELYFYRRPNPAYENDFIRILPQSAKYDWQKEAEKGQMFGRISLSLESWKRKQLDLEYAAEMTTATIVINQPVVEVKPGLWGININLSILIAKIKRWWRQKDNGQVTGK